MLSLCGLGVLHGDYTQGDFAITEMCGSSVFLGMPQIYNARRRHENAAYSN